MRFAATIVFLITSLATPTVASPQGTETKLSRGEAIFTQGGKKVTWKLWQGSTKIMADQGMTMASLQFSPTGKLDKVGDPNLTVGFMKMGDFVDLQSLALQHGPSGDAVYRTRGATCTLKVTKLEATAVEASGSCTGTFERGPAITDFSLKAAK